MVQKWIIERAGMGKEMAQAVPFPEVEKMQWNDRPSFATDEHGQVYYCEHRCLSSHRGGGTCNCINHPSESWVRVTEGGPGY